MSLKKLRMPGIRFMGASFIAALFVLVSLISVPVSRAQSGGAFGGAILEMVTPGGTSIQQAIASAGTTFYISGIVLQRHTIQNCTVPAGAEVFVNFSAPNAPPGRRVGTWRMWGVKAANDPTPNNASIPPTNNLSGNQTAVVNMSISLDSFNGTLELQGTLGRVFGAIESAGHPLTDVLAITGGTGTFRSASGDAILTPLTNTLGDNINGTGTPCSQGFFQVALQESPKIPRFGNIIGGGGINR